MPTERTAPDGGTLYPFRVVQTDPTNDDVHPEPGTVLLYYKKGEGWKTKRYGEDDAEFGGGSTGFGFTIPGDLTTDGNDEIPVLPVQRPTRIHTLKAYTRVAPEGMTDNLTIVVKRGDLATMAVGDEIGTITFGDGDVSAETVLSTPVLVDVGEFIVVEVSEVGNDVPGNTATIIIKGNG